MNDPTFSSQRERMVRWQIERRGISTPRVLAAFRSVPRHCFVRREDWPDAYEDRPLPIGLGQTISQPYIVALMTDLLRLQGGETVLEIGTGSGYQAAILSLLAGQVHTVERHELLAERARQALEALEALELRNVTVHTADGSLGWPEAAPYGGILVTAAAPAVPAPLLEQLAEGGRLVLPVGPSGYQVLQVWQREGGTWTHEDVIPVAFVPLRGQYGWDEEKPE
ncbi:MAG: protein-L-isoaspartate(D-aspartate) O-methyltransferase [Chloroflexi bacterium]|nr:protein-L-isoaspartate(D-aspartate) O-methyltransferase [Chloroflexota bacterium]